MPSLFSAATQETKELIDWAGHKLEHTAHLIGTIIAIMAYYSNIVTTQTTYTQQLSTVRQHYS